MKIYHFALITTILVGCQSNRYTECLQVEYLSQEILEKSIYLQAETLDYKFTEKFIEYGNNFYVYNDSLLVIAESEQYDGPLLNIINLRTKNPIFQAFNRGNGHNELLGIDIRLSNNQLIINDWVKQKIATLCLDSVKYDSTPQVNLIKHDLPVPVAFPSENGLIYANPLCFTDKNIGINQGYPKYPRLLLAKNYTAPITFSENEYYTGNVAGGGNILVGNERILYLSPHQSYLELFDKELNLLRRIEGSLRLEEEYDLAQMGDMKSVVFKNRIPYSYLSYCYDNNYVYITYIGDYLTKGKSMKDFNSYIIQINWDGEFIKSYSSDGYLFSISKSKDKDIFYATLIGDDETPHLVKLTTSNSNSIN